VTDAVHEPAAIDLDRERGLTIAWDDGMVSHYELEELRVNCPCAECRGLRERDQAVWPTPTSPTPLRAEGAELVGAWGLTISWNDGHGTGIFTWDVLRAWSDG
jgi:DUF971 family protein